MIFREYTNSSKQVKDASRILDFPNQAEQLLQLIEDRLQADHRAAALEYLIFKFKSLYEQGVSNGRLYEQEGIFPY